MYHRDGALKLYVMALLRATKLELKNNEMKTAYEQLYLSMMCPGVTLSKNVVGQHLHDLDRMYRRINNFMLRRTSRVSKNYNVAVDEMLKSDESKVNSLFFSALRGMCSRRDPATFR